MYVVRIGPIVTCQVAIKGRVDDLLAQKTRFKELSGEEWKAHLVDHVDAKSKETAMPATGAAAPSVGRDGDELKARVDAQGEAVRQLKSSGANKVQVELFPFGRHSALATLSSPPQAEVEAEVKLLLQLKEEYTNSTYLELFYDSLSLSLDSQLSEFERVVDAGGGRVRARAGALLQGILLVYDITNEKSFENVKNWMRNIDEHASCDVERMILGNKADCDDRRQVSKERGEQVRTYASFTVFRSIT